MAKKFYITTPIFYPNAKLHLGHAYTTVLADALARYHRLMGDETYLLTGSDENTEKVVRAAREAGQEVKPFLDGIVGNFMSLFSSLESSYDQFIRTSDENIHYPGAQALWRKLLEAGDIYRASYEGLYCVGHEAFITEKDLVDGKCPDHGTAPERLSEENYFFRLSRYSGRIKDLIESNELEIIPASRRGEILALLSKGLSDVSFSRPSSKVSIGIPVPGDASQRMYVWCDALSNYITAIGYGRDEKTFATWWPADLHVIGKDILRFHAAIWPAMLLSAGLLLPKRILVHGFITSGGKKMSKTLGNVIDPQELISEYGAEAVRYYLLRHVSPFEDGDITREGFKEAYNANLANGLGNLVSRTLTMAATLGVKLSRLPSGEEILSVENDYREHLEQLEVNRVLDRLFGRIGELDAYIQDTGPFKLIKTEPEKAREHLRYLLEELGEIAVLLRPFLPKIAKTVEDALLEGRNPGALFVRKE